MSSRYEELELYENPQKFVIVGCKRVIDGPKSTEPDHSNVLLINRVNDKLPVQKMNMHEHEKQVRDSLFDQMKTMTKIHALLGTVTLLSGKFLVVVLQKELIGSICGERIYRVTKVQFIPYVPSKFRTQDQVTKDREVEYIEMLNRVLVEEQSFYFSYNWDLTHRFQNQRRTSPNQVFFWNQHLSTDFSAYPQFIIPMIRGIVEIGACKIGSKAFTFGLITRTGCKRAGTRYNVRGADESGHVANYCETEHFVVFDGILTSFTQIRGSIPLLWNQQANLKYTPEIRFMQDRAKQREAFHNHFQFVLNEYAPEQMEQQQGPSTQDVGAVCINLCKEKGQEQKLSDVYKAFWQNVAPRNVKYETFDFHHECKNLDFTALVGLIQRLSENLRRVKFYARRFAPSENNNTWNTLTRTLSTPNLNASNMVDSGAVFGDSVTSPINVTTADLLDFGVNTMESVVQQNQQPVAVAAAQNEQQFAGDKLIDPLSPPTSLITGSGSQEDLGNAFPSDDAFGSNPFESNEFAQFESTGTTPLPVDSNTVTPNTTTTTTATLLPVSSSSSSPSSTLPPVPQHLTRTASVNVGYEDLERQIGVFRVNCIDCCDRTNITATYISRDVLLEQLYLLGITRQREPDLSRFPGFESLFNNFWTNNGDRISVLYTGTSALMNDYTRTGQRSMTGVLTDGLNSAMRYYKNNFLDSQRQRAMNLVLGLLDINSEEERNPTQSTEIGGFSF